MFGRSGARFSRADPPGEPDADSPDTEHSNAEHSNAEPSGTEYSDADFLDAEFAAADAAEAGSAYFDNPDTRPRPSRPTRPPNQGPRPTRIVMSPRAPTGDTGDTGAGPAGDRLRARPYVLTKGRTHARSDLAVETLISTDPRAPWDSRGLGPQYQAVRRICAQPRSVAEIAATLSVPLGVARVLLSDLADAGFVHVHTAPRSRSGRPDQTLMQRVLNGLHRL